MNHKNYKNVKKRKFSQIQNGFQFDQKKKSFKMILECL